MNRIAVIDSTLRDGAHILEPHLSPKLVEEFCYVYEASGLYGAEVGIGLGLGSPSKIKYDSIALLKAGRKVLKNTKLVSIIIPSIGTVNDIGPAAEAGIDMLRVAVYSTKPIDAVPFIREGKRQGVATGVFLMSSHFVDEAELAANAKRLEAEGADFLYIGDSSGAMTITEMEKKVTALVNSLKIPIGVHAHNCLGLGVALPLIGAMNGCSFVDGTLEGLGEGGGNANLQAVVALCEKQGFKTGVDFQLLNILADEKLRPLMGQPQELRTHHINEGFYGKAPKVLNNIIDP